MSAGVDVRESMRVLPAFLQPFLTWLTGKPLRGQQPWFRHNALTQVATSLAGLFGGAFAAGWAAHVRTPLAIVIVPAAWLFIVGAARKLQVTICHQCAHYAFSGSKRFDEWFVETCTTVLFIDHFRSYYREHVLIHHTKKLGTEVDPDCKFLLELGFEPGAPAAELKARLVRTIFSPVFHAKFLRARFRANFISAPPARRVLALTHAVVLSAAIIHLGWYAEAAVAWFFPLTLLYHVAALLNFSSLHLWLRQPDPTDSAKSVLCGLTTGRFVGEAAPACGNLRSWMSWTARMAFIHLPSRLAVLTGDLPVHDYHHRYPRCADWANYLYARQRDVENGCPGWPEPYTEVWGLKSAVELVMTTLAAAPALARADAALAPSEKKIFMAQL